MKIVMLATTVAAAALLAAPVMAQVNMRQDNQHARIQQGVRSGELSGPEAMRLREQQRAIARMEADMRARHGGRLTARDRALLNQRQARADNAIRRLKHNDRAY